MNADGFQPRVGRLIVPTRTTHARAEPAPALTKFETSESRSLFISPIPDFERNRVVPQGHIAVSNSVSVSEVDGRDRD
jgi:hypothetical protein